MKIDIKKIATANWHLKLMSLGLAVLIWILVTEAGKDEITMNNVPVLVKTPDNLAVWKMSRNAVRVKMEGPAGQLRSLRPGEVTGTFSVRPNRTEDDFSLDLDCEKDIVFSIPNGVKVAEVRPAGIKVDIVPKKEARVTVEAQLVGRPQLGYEISDVRIVPARVRVRGPEPAFKDLRAVQTVAVNVDGRTESFVDRVGIQKVVKGQMMEINETVQLRVQIEEELDTRTMKGLNIFAMTPPELKDNVTISPETVDITLKGQKQVLGALSAEKVVPFVRVNEQSAGMYRLPVELTIYTEGVEVLGVLPTVEVTIGSR